MQVTRRDIAVLAVFSLLLVAGTVLLIRRLTGAPTDAPAPRERATEQAGRQPVPRPDDEAGNLEVSEGGPPPGRLFASRLQPGVVPEAYGAITERKLFQPLVAERSEPARLGGASREFPMVPPVTVTERQEPIQPVGPTITPLPGETPPTTPSGATSQPGQPATERPQETTRQQPGGERERPSGTATPVAGPKPPLVATGLMRWGDGYRVVLEHTEQKRSQTVRVGGTAFGYRVRQVSEGQRSVTIDQPERPDLAPVTLKLGVGKVVERPVETAPTGEQKPEEEKKDEQPAEQAGGPPPPSRIGGFDPNNLTPEQRARWEEYRRRRGGSPGTR